MDESYACPWLTANSFFIYFSDGTFWDLWLFQRLNHFATIRAWKSTRLPWTIRAPTLFHIHTRAGKQADRRVYQPSVFVTTNVCVSCTIIPFGGAMMRRQVPSFRFFFLLFICLHWLRVESILVFTQLLIYLPTLFVCSWVDFVRHVLVVVHLLGLLAPGADLISPRLQLYGCVVCSTGRCSSLGIWDAIQTFFYFYWDLGLVREWGEGSTSDDLILKCHAFSKKIIKFEKFRCDLGRGVNPTKRNFPSVTWLFILYTVFRKRDVIIVVVFLCASRREKSVLINPESARGDFLFFLFMIGKSLKQSRWNGKEYI